MPAPGAAVQQTLVTQRSLPNAISDLNTPPGPPRGWRFGEQAVINPHPSAAVMADEGTLIVASMTPGQTALQLGLSAAFSATAAAVVLINGDNPGNPNARRVIPRKLRFQCNTAPTSATNWQYAVAIDNVNRQPTTITGGGNTAITPATATAYPANANNTNMANSNPVLGRCYFPASTSAGAPPAIPAAGPAARYLSTGFMRAQIPVAGDEYNLVFGVLDEPGPMLVTAAPAGASRIVVPHEPISLDPGHCLIVYLWGASNATAGFAFGSMDFSWIER
jgi:hypothetical protein